MDIPKETSVTIKDSGTYRTLWKHEGKYYENINGEMKEVDIKKIKEESLSDSIDDGVDGLREDVICPVCDKNCGSPIGLTSHLRAKHPKLYKEIKEEKEKREKEGKK